MNVNKKMWVGLGLALLWGPSLWAGRRDGEAPQKLIPTTLREGVFSIEQSKPTSGGQEAEAPAQGEAKAVPTQGEAQAVPKLNENPPAQVGNKAQPKLDETPHFRARWWNFEQRGQWHLLHDRPEQALKDFDLAVSLRPGDSWKARTYGMHFCEYFPQRGRGMALLQLRRYEEAMVALKDSLKAAPSQKAEYFLKKARCDQRLDREQDRSPPEISVVAQSVVQGQQQQFILKGIIKDDGVLTQVIIDDQPLAFEPLCSEVTVELPLGGQEGLRVIRLEATDGSGKNKVLQLPVFIDTLGPKVHITEVSRVENNLRVTFNAADPSGLKSFRLGQQRLDLKPGEVGPFVLKVPVATVENLMVLLAVDGQNNLSQTVVPYWPEEKP